MDVKIIMKIYLQQKYLNHFPSGFSMSTILSFKRIEKKHNRCKDYMTRFCESSKEQAMEIILKRKKWSH